MDVNSYHDVNFRFCFCQDHELNKAKQLFGHQLFPATVVQPETIFTMEVLDSFNIHHSTSTKSAESFCAALQKMSVTELPDDASVSAALYMCEIAQSFALEGFLPYLYASFTHSLTLTSSSVQQSCTQHWWFHHPSVQGLHCCTLSSWPWARVECWAGCLAKCAWEWKVSFLFFINPCYWTDCFYRHKYILFLDFDGTFNVPHINKLDDPYEEALNVGCAFVVEKHEYQHYLSHVEKDPPEVSVAMRRSSVVIWTCAFMQKCNCAKLWVLKCDHLFKFINLVVTGIVSFQCVCHIMFKPDVTVDMYAGER